MISAAATFGTQLLVRASATTTPEGTAATVQRLMLYVIPVGVLASGLLFNFPLGVLLYWFTSNLWTLGQQALHHPVPPADRGAGKPSASWARRWPRGPGRSRCAMAKAATGADDGGRRDRHPAPPAPPAAGGASSDRRVRRPTGQNRPGGKRPPAKRPTQAKKRR